MKQDEQRKGAYRLRESLPARVAATTGGLLALILLLVTASAYAITALMLRTGVDATLSAAMPQTGSRRELLHEAERFEREDRDDDEHRRMAVLDPSGQVLSVGAPLPVDPVAVREALREGHAFLSLVEEDGSWTARRGPDWWQALTPQEDEMRVMYRLAGDREEPVILQISAPLGELSEVLPSLFFRLLGLALVAVLLAGGIVWRMAGETYRPLKAVIATADDITTHTLSMRIPDVWHDATLRRLIQVLNAMIQRLQEAFDAQGRFVAAAAHELRGPLSAMRAELEVMLRRQRTPEEYRRALEGALEDTSRLTQLTEHLLTLARFERGMGLVMERDLPLRPLLDRAAAEALLSAGGEVSVEAAGDLLVDGDPIALERLVTNLAKNGVQVGGSPVAITAQEQGEEIVISVLDHGPGIPPGSEAMLFEPFYRADQARSRDGGTGLGLTIAKTVAEAHGGRIGIESSPGQGATFRIYLPRHQP